MQSLLLISALLVGALSASVAIACETDAQPGVRAFQPNQSAAYGIYGWDDFGQLQRRERRDKAGLPVYKLDFYWDTASRLRYVKQLGATASQAVIFTGSYAADGERISKTERQGSIAQEHALIG